MDDQSLKDLVLEDRPDEEQFDYIDEPLNRNISDECTSSLEILKHSREASENALDVFQKSLAADGGLLQTFFHAPHSAVDDGWEVLFDALWGLFQNIE